MQRQMHRCLGRPESTLHFVDPHVGLYCSIAVFLLLSLATVHNHWIYIIIVIPGSPSFIRAVEYFNYSVYSGVDIFFGRPR